MLTALCDKNCRLNMVAIETSSTKAIYFAVNQSLHKYTKTFFVLPSSFGPPRFLPNSFGPPTMVAAVVNFKDRAFTSC